MICARCGYDNSFIKHFVFIAGVKFELKNGIHGGKVAIAMQKDLEFSKEEKTFQFPNLKELVKDSDPGGLGLWDAMVRRFGTDTRRKIEISDIPDTVDMFLSGTDIFERTLSLPSRERRGDTPMALAIIEEMEIRK